MNRVAARWASIALLGTLTACGATDSTGAAPGGEQPFADAARGVDSNVPQELPEASSSTSGGSGSTGSGGASGAGGSGVAQGGAGGSSDPVDASVPVMTDARASDAATAPAFDGAAVKALMTKVAQYQLGLFTTPADNGWVNASFYMGLMAAYRATNDATLLAAARTWSTAHQWDIFMSTHGPRWADDQACTQTYFEIYALDPTPANSIMLTKGQAVFDAMIAAPQPGRVDWWWCDALYMGPPALARLAVDTKQTKYFDFMNTMWFDSETFLRDPKQSLFWRDKTFIGTDTYWARGNGWVVAGIARILEVLPEGNAKRGDYITIFKGTLDAIIKQQGADGLWRSDLLHPAAFPNPETSGSGFFTFAVAWGIAHGILDRATYLPVVQKAWPALVGTVNAAGRVGYVQGVGFSPGASTADETHPYGVAAFLLAGEQIIKL